MDKRTRDAILAEAKAADAIMATAEREDRSLTDVERDTITGHLSKADQIKQNYEAKMSFRQQAADLTQGLGLGPDGDPQPNPNPNPNPEPGPTGGKSRTSVGGLWTASNEYKNLLAAVPNGQFSEKMRVQSQPVNIPGGMKALFYSGDHNASAGYLVEPERRGLLAPFYERPLSIRQIVQNGTTNSDTIEFSRWASVTNNAAVVPEARSSAPIDGTTVTNALGGLKPESTFAFSRDSTTVKTIAHWIPITKRALSDAAQIRTAIDGFLRYGLEEELEDQLIAGSGTGENFLGLNNTPGIQTQAAPGAGQDVLDVTKLARTKVQIGGRAQPTAYVMNPLDWQGVELMRDDTGNFYGAGPFALSAPRLWGLPVVQSEAVAQGTAWVGAWNWAVLYDREQASVQATDSHADFFVRNLVAILAEMRAAFVVYRPSAFVKIALA